jgi:hypothetical protein
MWMSQLARNKKTKKTTLQVLPTYLAVATSSSYTKDER